MKIFIDLAQKWLFLELIILLGICIKSKYFILDEKKLNWVDKIFLLIKFIMRHVFPDI